MQDRFHKSIDNEIRMQIVHQIDGVPADKWPGYYGLVEFAVEKEKEILAERSQHKDSTHQVPRGTSVFGKPNCPARKLMPSARIVAPAPEEDDYSPLEEQSEREDSDSGKSYVATEKLVVSTVEGGVSEGDLEAVFRVARVMEDMTGRCFCCGKEGHRFKDPECPMYDANHLLNQQGGSAGSRRPGQISKPSQHNQNRG